MHVNRLESDQPAPSFNLVRDPWLLVRMKGGEIRELSLRELFQELHNIETLAGENSVQDAAILRLLLAITHSALGPMTKSGHDPEYADGVEEWASLWNDRAALREIVLNYLPVWESRFELFDSELPFYQVAGLSTGKDELGPLERFVFDVPNDVEKQYFTTRSGAGISSLSFAEAARWLVTIQAFDASGIKTGVLGDERTKGGKGYPIGPALAAQLGLAYVEVSSLEDTLLLNLVLGDAVQGTWFEDSDEALEDITPWEREGSEIIRVGVRPEALAGESQVRGVVDALSWQARRVLLQHDGKRVIGVIIANGDPISSDNLYRYEHMTAWRQTSSDAKKKTADTVLKPRTHSVDQALWRGVSGLLPVTTRRKDERGRELQAPGVLRWHGLLQAKGVLPRSRYVRVRSLGLEFTDAKKSKLKNVIEDHLDLSAALVGVDDIAADLASAIERQVRVTEDAVRLLGRFAENLAAAAGNRDSDVVAQTRERAFYAVDLPFRRWVGEIRADMGARELDAHELRWHQEARSIIQQIGREIAESNLQNALGGRSVNGHLIDAGRAQLYFQRGLSQLFDHTAEPASNEHASPTQSQ